MFGTDAFDQSSNHARDSHARPAPSARLELWHLRGATDDLRGLAIETSFGHAIALELDREIILLLLQPSIDALIAYADRMEAALLAQGWQRISHYLATRKELS